MAAAAKVSGRCGRDSVGREWVQMTPRMLAAIFSGVLSAGAMLLPVETVARPGGMAPGPAAMPPMRAAPPMVRPAIQPAMQGRIAPLARTGHPHPGRVLRDHHR